MRAGVPCLWSERLRGHQRLERRDVWRNLPAALRRAIVDDLAAVLREVNDEIGLSSEASRSQSGSVCSSIVSAAADQQSPFPKSFGGAGTAK
jgi:hypothetical protein